MAKQVYSIELDERQHKYLEDMVNKYNLPDVGKAIRCLADYAASTPDQEETVFQEVRCLDC